MAVEPVTAPRQPSLFERPATPSVDPTLRGLSRTWLDGDSWIDHLPGWVSADGALFDQLLATASWEQWDMELYGRTVDQPRLSTVLDAATRPAVIQQMRDVLSARYEVDFDSVLVNLYRDGRDSVAWHRDRVWRVLPTATVVTVSLGNRRRFVVRGRKSTELHTRFELGHGDLLVMGGRMQQDWEHSVPKVASAGPRMSVTMRHSR